MLSAGKKISLIKKKAWSLFPGQILINEPLAQHTTFKIGGPALFFFKAPSLGLLKKFINFCQKHNLKIFFIGGGSNLLAPDAGFAGIVIKLEGNFQKIIRRDILKIEAGAGAALQKLSNLAESAGLSGLEWAAGVPGTIGAAVAGGAGAFGQSIADIVEKIIVFDTQIKKLKTLPGKNLGLGYRRSRLKKTDLITKVFLSLKKEKPAVIKNRMKKNLFVRKKTQPLDFSGAGSIFKNPAGKFAGELIEQCGLKGKKIGQAQISEKHANFIVNCGRAKAKDVQKLIRMAQKKVKEKFGIQLEKEIIVL